MITYLAYHASLAYNQDLRREAAAVRRGATAHRNVFWKAPRGQKTSEGHIAAGAGPLSQGARPTAFEDLRFGAESRWPNEVL